MSEQTPPPPAPGTIGWADLTVPDLDAATRRCVELGGRLLAERRSAGPGSYCVIRDPAGAVAALYQPATT